MGIVLLIAAAWAAPRFDGAAADVALAAEAWRAATACAGWEAPAHEVVALERGDPGDGHSGRAFMDTGGLYRIVLARAADADTLRHEVAHAWADHRPVALAEGRADLLAACAGGGHWRVRQATYAGAPPTDVDLESWTNEGGDWTARSRAYRASAHLVVGAAEFVPFRALYPIDQDVDWAWFEQLLRTHGRGSVGLGDVLALLGDQPGVSDLDEDGLTSAAEALLGTDPLRWDTDGDGWRDGATPTGPTAVPAAPHASWTCSGWATSERAAHVRVVRDPDLPSDLWIQLGADEAPVTWISAEEGERIPPRRPIQVRTRGLSWHSGPVSGSVRLEGRGLVPDPGCRDQAAFVTWRAPSRYDERAFRSALLVAQARAAAVVGRDPDRLEVVVEGPTTYFADGRVVLGLHDLSEAWGDRRYDVLAAHAVAMHRVWRATGIVPDLDLVESLAWDLVEGGVIPTTVAPFNQGAWLEVARACPDGWWGVLEGWCGVGEERLVRRGLTQGFR